MSRFRRLTCAIVLAAVTASACGTDADVATPTTAEGQIFGSADDLKAVRLRNFNFTKSINKTMGTSTGAMEKGFDQAGGAISGVFSEAAQESGRYGRTAMSSVVDAWRDA